MVKRGASHNEKAKIMTNGKLNKAFLAVITTETKDMILKSIASHYCVSKEEIFAEVTDDQAEHLLDYMTGPERTAAHVLMQKYNCAKAA